MSVYPGTHTTTHADRDATTRAELSEFLKSRRARIAPASVGLPNGSRRRTPGLRREELADLAGVGLTWYTWLEQGRDIRVSSQVLAAIARALQLEPAERAHLFRLAGHAPPAPEPASAAISPRLQRVLDAWDPFPAHLSGRRRDVLAWNRAGEAINGWSRLPDDRRNLVWFMFMVPAARQLLVEWEKEAPLTVAALRAEAGRDLSAPDYQELIADLLAGSPDFAALWARQEVRGRREGLKRFQHPEFGRFDLEFTSFQVAEQPALRLSLYTPADDGHSEMTLREVVAAGAVASR